RLADILLEATPPRCQFVSARPCLLPTREFSTISDIPIVRNTSAACGAPPSWKPARTAAAFPERSRLRVQPAPHPLHQADPARCRDHHPQGPALRPAEG